MKNFIRKFTPWLVLAAMFVMLIPGVVNRNSNENKNKNVTVSIYFNSFANALSGEALEETFDEMKKIGINYVTVPEEDINYLVTKGLVTCIKYNVLCHKYDNESLRIAEKIAKVYPNIAYDSHIMMVKRPFMKDYVKSAMENRYTKNDYLMIENVENMDIYILHDGRKPLWEYQLCYNEETIKTLREHGFNIVLSSRVGNYSNTGYLENMERIIKENDIEILNLRPGNGLLPGEKLYKNTTKIYSDIINKNDMTLVVMENPDHLSNQKFIGYEDIYKSVTDPGGSNKVIRGYETMDDTQDDGSHYKHRVSQYFNSTIDRNMRFISLTLIAPDGIPYDMCSTYSLKAINEYISEVKKCGFTVNGSHTPMQYSANIRLNSAASAVIMIMFVLIMYNLLASRKSKYITWTAYLLAIGAFILTMTFMPMSLVNLYPTVYSAVMSCFAITIILSFVKKYKDRVNFALLLLSSTVLTIITLLICAMGLAAMLSGMDYYINNSIFRGIKISLIAPVAFTAIAAYFMFIKDENTSLVQIIKNLLYSEIKVYWVIIGAVIAAMGAYYLIRSGNVNHISNIEQLMRSKVTEIFPARPRTKEFIIGYPALLLFVYYIKNYDIKLFKWGFAVGTSILAASVTNSFCHVFTDYTVICTRVINGLIVGAVICVVVHIVNLLAVKVCKTLKNKF